MSSSRSVSQLVALAFRTASTRYSELQRRWIERSHRLGSLLPDSLLVASIQQAGKLDVLVRCMEDDPLPSAENPSEVDILSFSYRDMLSAIWVGSAYEICRVLDGRKLMPESNELKSLHHDLKLLRIPLEKYEIANHTKLLETLEMTRFPPSAEERDRYVYTKKDPLSTHIMPSGLSERGSCMWHVIDAVSQKSYWIERRSVSDRFLAL